MNKMLIVGGGIFGLTAAIELNRRGYEVRIVDQGPIPHPLAASTDISKVVRMEYGGDLQYMEMVEHALIGWHTWNDHLAPELYHETGVTMLTRGEMRPGGFEFESFQALLSRGHAPERLTRDDIERRFPAWSGAYVDGFFHAAGGFAESGRVVEVLARHAATLGVVVTEGTPVDRLLESSGCVRGVVTTTGERIEADHTIVAAGAWTTKLLPQTRSMMKVTGHPVYHLKPEQPAYFKPPLFVTFTADVARTGWYGFPLHPTEGVVKVGNHGVGMDIEADEPRTVGDDDDRRLRAFLEESFPALLTAPIVYRRRCLYSDTLDGHFILDHLPGTEGISVATGGSGHGFKFAPILGPLIADMVEKTANPWLEKFRWRALAAGTGGQEAARYHGE